MRKLPTIVLPLLVLLAAVPLLAACNTTAGAGKDISNAGKALENSAEKHSP
jgi:predicted small secreted protein